MDKDFAKAIEQLVGMVLNFIFDLATVKLGWDLLLVKLFPTLPVITWFQALVIYWICSSLFKQKTVTVYNPK